MVAEVDVAEMEQRDWSQLPTALLVSIFDDLITCATAHPSYLAFKSFSVAAIRLTGASWLDAVNQTPIGVCLPPRLPPHIRAFLCTLTLRRVEFHDPEHTHPSMVQLLSNPKLVAKSCKSMLTIMDAPYDAVWKPTDFPNLAHLEVRRYGKASPVWDVACLAGMTQLSDLVLASGFKSMRNLGSWPSACKHLVWNSTADRFSSRLSVPSLPPMINLHFMSLRACEVRLLDPMSLLGHVQEIMIHAELIFVKVPWTCYPSLQEITNLLAATTINTAALSPATTTTAAPPSLPASPTRTRTTAPDPTPSSHPHGTSADMAPAGATAADGAVAMTPSPDAGATMAEGMVTTTPGPNADENATPAQGASLDAVTPTQGPSLDAATPTQGGETGSSRAEEGGVRATPARAARAPVRLRGRHSDDWVVEGLQALADMCVNESSLLLLRLKFIRLLVSHPTRSGQDPAYDPMHDTHTTWQPPHHNGHEGSDDGSFHTTEDDDEANHNNEAQPAAAAQPAAGNVCRSCGRIHGDNDGGGGHDSDGDEGAASEDEDLTYDEASPDQVERAFQIAIRRYEEVVSARTLNNTRGARRHAPAPAPAPLGGTPATYGPARCCGHVDGTGPPEFVVPLLKTGKPQPSQEREVTITRKHADPREPATLKLDLPVCPLDQTLAHQAPLLIASKRPVQSLAFAPWPYTTQQLGVLAPEGEAVAVREWVQEAEQLKSSAALPPDPTPAAGGLGQHLRERLLQLAFGASQGRGLKLSKADELLSKAAGVVGEEQAREQAKLLGSASVVEAWGYYLRKVNFLVLAPQVTSSQARSLLAPFQQLTKVSLVLLQSPSSYSEPIFPLTVIKVTLLAGTGNKQHFNSKMVSNLTELWRLTLSGFHSHDLSHMPTVRPGFELKVLELTREEPLGDPSLDTLPSKGHILDLSLQSGTEKPPAECEMRVTRVHLTQWAPLIRDMHVRSPAGVELWTGGARNEQELFKKLTEAGIQQFTVSFTTDAQMSIAVEPVDLGLRGPFLPLPPVFAFIMARNRRVHGMHVAEIVRGGRIPGWDLEFHDAEALDVGELTGMFTAYISFFRTDLDTSGPPSHHDAEELEEEEEEQGQGAQEGQGEGHASGESNAASTSIGSLD